MMDKLTSFNNIRWILQQCKDSGPSELSSATTQDCFTLGHENFLNAYCNIDPTIGKYSAIGYVSCQELTID